MHESSASACPCAAGPTLKPTIGSVIADDLSKYGDSNSLADENEDNEADVAPGSSAEHFHLDDANAVPLPRSADRSVC